MDWAWCFSRGWHHARYTAIFDEALRLAAGDPAFCLFVDSLVECLEPYFATRPEARPAWNGLVAMGRIAVVGGQYSNLRPSTSPEELFLRNLEVGRLALADMLPAARPQGYANLDTAIGHSQLPQILSLAGYRYLLAGRSEGGLADDGVPPIFRWQAPDASSLLVLVQHYGICTGPCQCLDHDDPAVRARALDDLARRLEPQRELGLGLAYAIIGADDTRYLHDPVSDRPYDLQRCLHEWSVHQGVTLAVATPDELALRLGPHLDRIPSRQGPVDQADVGYNGPFGQTGLRELRDRTAAALVEAETYECLVAAGAGKAPRTPSIESAWRTALRAQAHATQYLLDEDAGALRLDLALALRQAEQAREAALEAWLPSRLPQDSPAVAVLNPLPWTRSATVAVPVTRTDFSVPGYRLEDAHGTPLPQQSLASPNRDRPGEWSILVRTALPACGYQSLRLVPTGGDGAVTRGPEALPLSGTVAAGPVRLGWVDGFLMTLQAGACGLAAGEGQSLLEPTCRPIQVQGWLTTSIGSPSPRLQPMALVQTEWGPLRWCFERTAQVGSHRLRQWLYVYDDGRIEVVTDVDYGPDNAFFGLALPCPTDAALTASVPFGVEPRRAGPPQTADAPAAAPPIERLIPGLFYARDWVRVESAQGTWALVVLDGDRYWLCRSAEGRLEHLLLRATGPIADGWEQFTRMNRPGHLRFRHGLALGAACSPEGLSRLADEARFPARPRITCGPALRDGLSLARLDCEHVRLLSCRRLGRETELRLVESAGRPAQVTMELQGTPRQARLADLVGNPLGGATVEAAGPNALRFAIGPWQLRTLRFRWARAPQPAAPDGSAGPVTGDTQQP
jgi:hypothetical protein